MAKDTAPGVPVASAKATAIKSYALGTAASLSSLAGLSKFCQYPVMKCAGSVPLLGGTMAVGVVGGVVGAVVGGVTGGVVAGGVVGVGPPPQAPLSAHTSHCPLAVGTSPWVHHFAV